MEDYRSKSLRDPSKMQIEAYSNGGRGAPTSMQDLRSYSSSYASSVHPSYGNSNLGPASKEVVKIKKIKNDGLGSTSKSWSLSDPELQRKKRVAGYKVYTVEGKMKGSLRKSFRLKIAALLGSCMVRGLELRIFSSF
ncbi:hypothetical protein RJ639_014997 [Escallonia herrerae]|uniref:Uncharacterized protein n=1 Tax=Escallonia herrerae TaxID=1293975 RepID=A0AA88VEU7_9ASTE|nr:hypothetical protein RJ639_014997 [Escallonia herrerae]